MGSNVMEHSSSSKVTVEYHDPSGVFPLIARELANRLPLRNLNWQSNTRPLRQIKHLHVEFVPDAETEAILQPTTSKRSDADRPTSVDILRGGASWQKGQAKERRHQIPGLKTTPYLKIYILRCDDKNWYKQEERQKLKAWVRDILPSTGKQEKHDAFQWLIVHVVIPDTIAASEPRWRESTRDPDELKERNKGTNAKWPGKPPKTVFDRLRSDFNDGKPENNHIAQIRLPKSQISLDLLPVPALARTLEETADEREKSWNDLMTKIRTSILGSFDARVRQYEDDIAEQEARLALPGWNFCTFFIHKEGLARALESVGLLEDALTIYDELALGLETIIMDLATGKASQTATSFPPTGAEIVQRIVGTTNGATGSGHSESSRRLFEKDYRQEIVRSAVSTFDFFCYLFDRQTALISRLAGRSTSAKSESGVRETGEDLVMLAEICWRGLSFIHNAARTLKQDLCGSDKSLTPADVHSLATSWTFSAADFVLERTTSVHLDLSDAGIKSPGKLVNGHTEASRRPEFGFSMGADAHPARISSLPAKKSLPKASEVKSVASNSSAGRISEDGLFSPPSSAGGDEIRPEVPGLAELGAYRAELVVLKRKMLEDLASAKGWYAGWSCISLQHIDLDCSSSVSRIHEPALANSAETDSAGPGTIGSDVSTLLQSKDTFNDAFEALTETAICHYLSATHSKSAEKLMGDLAILKYQEHDYESAATFFEHVSPVYRGSGWSFLNANVVALHADCLERLGRHRESVISTSSLVAQVAQTSMHHEKPTEDSVPLLHTGNNGLGLKDCNLETLVTRSELLADNITLPLLDFFADLQVGHEISHSDNQDGFVYRFKFRHLLDNDLSLDRIVVRLVSANDASQHIILQSSEATHLAHGLISVEVRSRVTSLGVYLLDCIDLHAKKIVFSHCFAPEPQTAPLALAQASEHDTTTEDTRPALLLYPCHAALDAQISTAEVTALHKSRHMAITLSSGWNNITSLDIKLKPTSAGLRLHTTEIVLSGIELRQDSSFRTGIIQLGPLAKQCKAVVHVRYSLEQAKSELTVKAQIDYRTQAGDYCFLTDARLPTQLPIDVEVNDVFQQTALFSTFAVRTMDGMPTLLNAVELVGTKVYEAEAPPVAVTPALILPGQAADLAFIIRRRQASGSLTTTETTMELILDCMSASDTIKHTLQSAFSAQLQSSGFGTYSRLLLPVLVERFRHAFGGEDFEQMMLLREARTPSFADLGWYEVIDTLPTAEQRPLSDWLMKWHIEHQRIAIDVNTLPAQANKRFVIAVSVPELDYIFTVSLAAESKHDSDAPVLLGQPHHLKLTISASSQWMRNQKTKETAHTFAYDVLLNEDVWMLDGQRRARFSVGPDAAEYAADMILVPLKAGMYSLPSIDIQPASPVQEGASDGEARKQPSCVTNLTYSGRGIQVVQDRRRTDHIVLDADEA